MFWRPAAGLLASAFLSCVASAANKPPCESGADCAFRLVREMTMKQAERAEDGDALRHWMDMTDWLERVDPRPDPAAARVRFDLLRKQVRRVNDREVGPLCEQWLASAMIEAGLLAEAEKLAATLPAENRDRVYGDLAADFARRGNWRESIRVLELMEDERGNRPSVYQEVLGIIADAGRPELIQETAALMKKPPEGWDPIGSALVELAAGREDEAVKRALARPELGWRLAILDSLANHSRAHKREADALRLEEKMLELVRTEGGAEWGKWLAHEDEWYFRHSVQAGEYPRALKAWPRLRKDERDPNGAFTTLLMSLRRPEDIAAAGKLLAQLSGGELEYARKALAWSRVLSGLVEPRSALKELEDPPAAGRHLIEWLGRDEYVQGVDGDRARALLSVSRELNASYESKSPVSDYYPEAVVKAQIMWGLLDDARKGLRALPDPHDRAVYLLLLAAAHAKLGQADRAQEAKAEGTALLAQAGYPKGVDDHADVLVRVGLLDEAEIELRRLMQPDPLPPPFIRVAKPLLEKRVERGEVDQAFKLALDWSALHGNDPEALANFYSFVKKSDSPPFLGPGLLGQLRKLMKQAEDRR